MSLGGLTTIALADQHPDLVRRVVLVDVTPKVEGPGAAAIVAFVNGPESFADFDELLARTIEFNPTRSESSLRRGILHNALQREDGSWVWRYRRFTDDADAGAVERAIPTEDLWDALGRIAVPLMLVRGMRPGSVVDDDGRGRAAPPAARRPASSTWPRPATACRATTRSPSPACSPTSSRDRTCRPRGVEPVRDAGWTASTRAARRLSVAVTLAVVPAASPSCRRSSPPASRAGAPVPTPTLTEPPAGLKGFPLWDSYSDLAPFGYEEQEYFVSGTAVDAGGDHRAVHDADHRHPARSTPPTSTAPCCSTG